MSELQKTFSIIKPDAVATGKAGKITPLEDTIRSFEELCAGKWDHLPEGAFMYVGGIDEADEQAKKMAQG